MPQQEKEHAHALCPHLRQGQVRRKVTRGRVRGWEQRSNVDLKHFGADVIDLGEYQLRWFENRHGISKPRYASAGTTYVAATSARGAPEQARPQSRRRAC